MPFMTEDTTFLYHRPEMNAFYDRHVLNIETSFA